MLLDKYSHIAQSVEQVTVNHKVVGSSPIVGANKIIVQLVLRRLAVGLICVGNSTSHRQGQMNY